MIIVELKMPALRFETKKDRQNFDGLIIVLLDKYKK